MRTIKTSESFRRKVRQELRAMEGNYVLLQNLTSQYGNGILRFKFEDKRLEGKITAKGRDQILIAFGKELNFGHGMNSTGIRYVNCDIKIAFGKMCCERIGVNVARYFRIYRKQKA